MITNAFTIQLLIAGLLLALAARGQQAGSAAARSQDRSVTRSRQRMCASRVTKTGAIEDSLGKFQFPTFPKK